MESDKLSLCLVIRTSTCLKMLGIFNIRILRIEITEIFTIKISNTESVQHQLAKAKLV